MKKVYEKLVVELLELDLKDRIMNDPDIGDLPNTSTGVEEW